MTPEQKKLFWGDGPWVNEPDLEEFEHKGFKCEVKRIVHLDEKHIEPLIKEWEDVKNHVFDNPINKYFTTFGGHLCGYVCIPKDHPWFEKDSGDIDCDIHGGLTYFRTHEDGNYWIGFDCAHSKDIVPSMIIHEKQMMEVSERYKKIMEKKEEFNKHHGKTVLDQTYKAFWWVVEETKNLAEQAKKVMNK